MQCKDIDTKEVLQLINDTAKTGVFAYDVLAVKYPSKVFYAKLDKLSKYIDYGVSLRTGWLNDKGKAKLVELGGML